MLFISEGQGHKVPIPVDLYFVESQIDGRYIHAIESIKRFIDL
jgi:hypothetical protein